MQAYGVGRICMDYKLPHVRDYDRSCTILVTVLLTLDTPVGVWREFRLVSEASCHSCDCDVMHCRAEHYS